MKYDVFISMKGPAREIIDSPHTGNPIEAESVQELMGKLSLPKLESLGVRITGVKIQEHYEYPGSGK